MFQYVLKLVDIDGLLCLELPRNPAALENLRRELGKCANRGAGYALITLQPPKRPRTTGKDSQSAHFHGHCQQISRETGQPFDDVKMAVKMLAVSMGYPATEIHGQTIPQSEAAASTDEEAILIEAAHVLAADLEIILIESEVIK